MKLQAIYASLINYNMNWRGLVSRIVCAFIPTSRHRRQFQEFIGYQHRRITKDNYGNRKIVCGEKAQSLILESLRSAKPCMIGRFGTVEFRVAYHYLRNGGFKKDRDTARRINRAGVNAGFFPATPEYLARFSTELFGIINNADVMGVWKGNLAGEEYVLDICCSKARLIGVNDLNPIYSQEPWTQYLKGKKVLIIHPFEKSIIKQYPKREKLFENKKILPEFQLMTLTPVQSIAGNYKHLPFSNWFEALEHTKREISKLDFDISLIAAGAYGMFLTEYCKSIGKQSIYMGSFLQLLFGIYGQRWVDEGATFINEHWVRPMVAETPENAHKVEKGCYW
jgi:hypothetical protein